MQFKMIYKIKWKRFFISLSLILLTILIPFILAYAVEEGSKHQGVDWKGWLWKVINFAILIFILVKFLTKPIKNYLRNRTELIERSLSDAMEAKELAQRALKEVEEKLSLKDDEIKHIIASARQSGKAEREDLIRQGREMIEKIRGQAMANIEMELKQAKASLKAEVAEMIVKLTEERLKQRLSDDEQIKLLEESLKKLEG